MSHILNQAYQRTGGLWQYNKDSRFFSCCKRKLPYISKQLSHLFLCPTLGKCVGKTRPVGSWTSRPHSPTWDSQTLGALEVFQVFFMLHLDSILYIWGEHLVQQLPLGLRPQISFPFRFLLVPILEGSVWWLKYLFACQPCERPGKSSGIRTLSCYKPSCCGNLGIMSVKRKSNLISLFLSVSIFQINKILSSFKCTSEIFEW